MDPTTEAGRTATPSASRRAPGPPSVPGEGTLRRHADADAFVLLRGLETSRRGLTEDAAAQRLAVHGENVPAADRRSTAAQWARRALASPFAGLMTVLGALLAVTDGVASAAVVLIITALGIGVRLWHELRAERAARVLRARIGTTVTVRRRPAPGVTPRESEVPPADLVPGDVVLLGAGDPVPADARVLRAGDVLVDQSSLSGELLPVPKGSPVASARPRRLRNRPATASPVTTARSLLLAGSTVVRGEVTAVVLATGSHTHVEQLAGRAHRPRPSSAVDRGVRAVSWTLVRCMLVAAPLVLVVNGAVSGDARQALLFAVAVTVGLAPELLPLIVGTTLLRGAARLRDRGVLVTRPDAIHDLGAIDVACLDKTGTLTEDRMVLAHSIDVDGRPDPAPAEAAAVGVRFQATPRDGIDEALAGAATDGTGPAAGGTLVRVEELPFDHARRRAAVVLQDGHGPGELLIVRGDPDTVLPRCTQVVRAGTTEPLNRALRAAAADTADAHRARGLRVVAVATRRAHAHDPDPEHDLRLLGFVGLADPVRASAAGAVARFREQGIAVRVLTGDDAVVAEQVCERAGIAVDGVLDGPALDGMNDIALAAAVQRTTVFARLGPLHKERVVAALQARGHTVGFLGDGVNDVGALRSADVGIGVDGAVPAARAAADIVLTDRGPEVVVAAVTEGRRTLGRATRYLTVTAALNVGNALSVVVASAVLPFLPLLPAQLVLQSVLFGLAALSLSFDRVEPGWTARPRTWDTRGMLRFMAVLGPLSSVFDLLTFWAVWRFLGLDTPQEQAVFQAVWFVEGVLSQALVLLLLRTRAGRPARPVVLAVVTVVAVGVAVPFTPLAPVFGMVAPPPAVWPLLAAVVPPFLVCAAATRPLYLRHVLGIAPAEEEGAR